MVHLVELGRVIFAPKKKETAIWRMNNPTTPVRAKRLEEGGGIGMDYDSKAWENQKRELQRSIKSQIHFQELLHSLTHRIHCRLIYLPPWMVNFLWDECRYFYSSLPWICHGNCLFFPFLRFHICTSLRVPSYPIGPLLSLWQRFLVRTVIFFHQIVMGIEPIPSMYGLFTFIYYRKQLNVPPGSLT